VDENDRRGHLGEGLLPRRRPGAAGDLPGPASAGRPSPGKRTREPTRPLACCQGPAGRPRPPHRPHRPHHSHGRRHFTAAHSPRPRHSHRQRATLNGPRPSHRPATLPHAPATTLTGRTTSPHCPHSPHRPPRLPRRGLAGAGPVASVHGDPGRVRLQAAQRQRPGPSGVVDEVRDQVGQGQPHQAWVSPTGRAGPRGRARWKDAARPEKRGQLVVWRHGHSPMARLARRTPHRLDAPKRRCGKIGCRCAVFGAGVRELPPTGVGPWPDKRTSSTSIVLGSGPVGEETAGPAGGRAGRLTAAVVERPAWRAARARSTRACRARPLAVARGVETGPPARESDCGRAGPERALDTAAGYWPGATRSSTTPDDHVSYVN